MQTIHRCAVDIDLIGAITAARVNHGLPERTIADPDVVLATVISAAFGGHDALRPWMQTRQMGTVVTVVGGGDRDTLLSALDRAAPTAQAVISDIRRVDDIVVEGGARYRFKVRVCPSANVDGKRYDYYRHQRHIGREITPEAAYEEWLRPRLAGTTPERVYVDGFKTTTAARRAKADNSWSTLGMPDVTMAGTLVVDDADVFSDLVRKGLGRQKAYGFGAFWLERIV
jgi:CRISPR-associated protein Cas6/Cse3/CasE subtype I-E